MSDTNSEPRIVDLRNNDLRGNIESNESFDLKHKELLENQMIPETKKPRKCVCVKDVKHKIIHK